MEDVDLNVVEDFFTDDDHLMNSEVICGEAELYYLDCYLKELFRPSGDL